MKGIKYIRQPTHFSCGPIALYNLVLWCDYHTTVLWCDNPSPKFTYRRIYGMSNVDPSAGTLFKEFNNIVQEISNHYNLKVYLSNAPKLYNVKKHLDNGGLVLLNFHWEENSRSGDHYIMLVGFGGNICVVNPNDKGIKSKVIKDLTDRQIKSMLYPHEYNPPKYSKHEDNVYPKAWFIGK